MASINVCVLAVALLLGPILLVAADGCAYLVFSKEHTMCARSSCRTEKSGLSSEDKKTILKAHNKWRSRLANGTIGRFPPAANMMYLRWDPEIAKVAQAHANLCRFEHDCSDCRRVKRFSTGQNLFMAWAQTRDDKVSDWNSAVDSWFDEYRLTPIDVIKKFRFGSDFGHFTQAAWATTQYIGCGYSMYRENQRFHHLYTCNYGPAGNMWNSPVYRTGKQCSLCPKRTKCSRGLCK